MRTTRSTAPLFIMHIPTIAAKAIISPIPPAVFQNPKDSILQLAINWNEESDPVNQLIMKRPCFQQLVQARARQAHKDSSIIIVKDELLDELSKLLPATDMNSTHGNYRTTERWLEQ